MFYIILFYYYYYKAVIIMKDLSESSTLGPIMVMTVELIALLLLLSSNVELSGLQGPLLPSRLLPLMAPIAYIS